MSALLKLAADDDMADVSTAIVGPRLVGAPLPALIYCPICTHTVDAQVSMARLMSGRRVPRAIAGQKCPRCAGSLDAGYVVRVQQAA